MKFLAVALVSLLFIVLAQSWEGVYEYEGGANYDFMNLCEEDDWIQGNYGRIGVIQARITGVNPFFARGHYYGVGHKIAGRRTSYRNFLPNTGKVNMTLAEDLSSVTIVWEERTTGVVSSVIYALLESEVESRVVNCRIIDRNSTETLDGGWSVSSFNLSLQGCVDDRDFVGSIDLQGSPVYVSGYCVAEGQICAGDSFTQNLLGNAMLVKLSDGTAVVTHYLGIASMLNFTESVLQGTGFSLLATQGSTSPSNCSSYVDQWFNPRKCRAMEAEDCGSQEYFCEFTDNFCVQIPFSG